MPDVRIKFVPSKKSVLLRVIDEDEVLASFRLKAKKSLDGNIIIFDHADIDIVLMPEQKKVVTFRKEGATNDISYGASDRMFKYLIARGVINPGSVQGGQTIDSFEGQIPESNVEVPIKVVMLTISKWMEGERPYFEYGDDYDDLMQDRFLDPDEEESTELGEVPHDKSKGSIVPGYYRSPYWMSYILEQKE